MRLIGLKFLLILCLYQISYTAVTSTQLFRQYWQSFVMLMWLNFSAFCLTCYKDPGYVEPQVQDIDSMQQSPYPTEPVQCQLQTMRNEAYCQHCEPARVKINMRQKHCEHCKKCISTMDHHCTFMDTCIGEFNRPYFYIWSWLVLIHASYSQYRLIQFEYNSGVSIKELPIMFNSLTLIVQALSLMLMGSQTWLMLINVTTGTIEINAVELGAGDEPSFNKGALYNLKMYWHPLWQSANTRIKWELEV